MPWRGACGVLGTATHCPARHLTLTATVSGFGRNTGQATYKRIGSQLALDQLKYRSGCRKVASTSRRSLETPYSAKHWLLDYGISTAVVLSSTNWRLTMRAILQAQAG